MLNTFIRVVAPVVIAIMLVIGIEQTLNVDRQQQISTVSTTASNSQKSQSGGSNESTQPSQQPTSPSTPATTASSSSNLTSNWAGYATSGGTYSGISGSWTVPNPGGSDASSADATWIGIGGINSNDLIQVGTQNVLSADGQIVTSAFYELLPNNSQPLSGVSVNPGDSVSASLSLLSSGEWDVTFMDNTTGSTYNNVVYYNSSESSAEWIEEDPSDEAGQMPFDDFGSVNFTDCSTSNNGQAESLSSSDAEALTMVNSASQDLAETSQISSSGSNFSVSRTSASSVEGNNELGYSSDSGVNPGTRVSEFGHWGWGFR